MCAVLLGPTWLHPLAGFFSAGFSSFFSFVELQIIAFRGDIAVRSQELDMGIRGKLMSSFFMSKNHFNFPYVPIWKVSF